MEIKHDKSLVRDNKLFRDMGFNFEAVNKICFQGTMKSKETTETAIQEIKDYLEDSYKMYQYKKDNGVKYNQHELFYWSGGNDLYFDVSINYDIVKDFKIIDDILSYVENKYNSIDLYVRIQYTNEENWDNINNYLSTTNFDIKNLPFNIISNFAREQFHAGNHITEDNKTILMNLEIELLKQYEGKKVRYESITDGIFGTGKNIIIGTLKQLGNGYYGVFKPKATRTYYPISLSNIYSLQKV